MRFFLPIMAALAALATAQTNNSFNKVNIPPNGLQITAGQPTTITWSDPSSGTVTIKLQQGAGSTASSGVTVASGISASAGTATFTIDPNSVNTFQYSIEIIDDTNPNNINFTPNFGIAGATGSDVTTTATGTSASATGTSASASASSASSASTASVSSVSASASSSASSASAKSSGASSASSSSATKTSSSATAASSTSAPTGNSAVSYKSQSGLLIAVIGALAVF